MTHNKTCATTKVVQDGEKCVFFSANEDCINTFSFLYMYNVKFKWKHSLPWGNHCKYIPIALMHRAHIG